MTKKSFINQVIQDCKEYAEQYNCTFKEALYDWEGDGPNGSWGLTGEEEKSILNTWEELVK